MNVLIDRLGLRVRLFLVLTAAIPAFLTAGPADAQTKIVLSFSAAASFSNLFVAADQGLLTKGGLDVDMKLIPNSGTTPAALLANSVQIAGLTAATTLQAAEAGMDLVVLAGGGITSKGPSEAAVLGRIGSNIKKPEDFIGKKVAAPALNAFLHVLFRQWLTDNGVDWRKVNFVEVPLQQMGDILRSGQVDAALTSEPFKSRTLEAKGAEMIAPYVAQGPSGIFATWYISTRKWADANKDAVKGFQSAIAQATAMTANNDVTRKAVATYLKLPPDALAQTPIPEFQAEIKPKDIDAWVSIALSQDLIKTKMDANRLMIR